MANLRLCVIPGDGIGQEVIPAAVVVLKAIIPNLEIIEAEAGWDCFLKHGESVPDETIHAIHECGAALFGAVSSPSEKVMGYQSAIITLRQKLKLYANLRPVQSWPDISPRDDINMLIIRENTEGLYIGREWSDGETAIAERVITKTASRRIALLASSLIQTLGRKQLTIVHKANVLNLTDGLFRDQVLEVFKDSKIEINQLLVDIAALKMLSDPHQYDTIITTNLYGDILSDIASYWMGGMGFAPSLNLGDEVGLAEPVHGSAPDIAGRGLANPIAAILSTALLARFVWQREDVASRIENAVHAILTDGILHNLDHNITQRVLDAVLEELEGR